MLISLFDEAESRMLAREVGQEDAGLILGKKAVNYEELAKRVEVRNGGIELISSVLLAANVIRM